VGNSSWKIAGLLLTLLLVGSSELFSRAHGRYFGTVTDQTGAVLAGATVKVTSLATGEVRTVNSNDHGDMWSTRCCRRTTRLRLFCAVSNLFSAEHPGRGGRPRARGCFAGNRRSDRTVEVEAATPCCKQQLDPGNDGGGEVGAGSAAERQKLIQLAQLTVARTRVCPAA